MISRAVAGLDRHVDGGVGARSTVLVTPTGVVFTAVSRDTDAGTEPCPENASATAMLRARHHRVATAVTVTVIAGGRVLILPPCRRCRATLHRIDPANLDTVVVLGRRESVLLGDLMPHQRSTAPRRGRTSADGRA